MAGLMSTLEPHVFSAYYPHFCRQSGLSHSHCLTVQFFLQPGSTSLDNTSDCSILLLETNMVSIS